MACDYHTTAERRVLVNRMAWAMRELLQGMATTAAGFATLVEMDELIADVRSENVNHRLFAVDRARHYLETQNKSPGAEGAQGLLMLRVMAELYHEVLVAEALAGAAATESGKA